MKILAAIVTHNRCDLLARAITYVELQTRPPDALVVINNSSTDGTLSMLEERGVGVITQDNVGSAGGWHSAIQHALDEDFEAVWLMDDDGFPDVGALEGLERALIRGVACASSVVLQEGRVGHFVFPFPILGPRGYPVVFGWPRKVGTLEELWVRSPGGNYEFAHLFNGALVSLDAVRRIGNVNRDFFIYAEEVDYFFRLRKVGSVISVLGAKHYHPDVSTRPYNPMKVYYYVKNALILNRLHYNHVWLRHGLMIGVILYRILLRNGARFTISLVGGGKAPVFYSAIARGLQGRIGRDFNA